ncbi:hypothetical protein EW145_g2059 [Phellinidium pouzarii]|uniref:Uncharacterized protein n=1 Tax=Phellinidium pouzarii TaxID=167371 RepID=A0A4S4LC93_9AGAM|nr:hypothetical protein EW145_g2059 [Phellinidium pouzarii]
MQLESPNLHDTLAATQETVQLNEPHTPHGNAIEAFSIAKHAIRAAIAKSRTQWDKHEPRMWARAKDIRDEELLDFDVAKDLVLVRSGPTAYGTIIFGKIRIPAIRDELGEGFVHVRIHDPPNRGESDVLFHSILTDEGNRDADGHPQTWNAVQTADTPLEFFNE